MEKHVKLNSSCFIQSMILSTTFYRVFSCECFFFSFVFCFCCSRLTRCLTFTFFIFVSATIELLVCQQFSRAFKSSRLSNNKLDYNLKLLDQRTLMLLVCWFSEIQILFSLNKTEQQQCKRKFLSSSSDYRNKMNKSAKRKLEACKTFELNYERMLWQTSLLSLQHVEIWLNNLFFIFISHGTTVHIWITYNELLDKLHISCYSSRLFSKLFWMLRKEL